MRLTKKNIALIIIIAAAVTIIILAVMFGPRVIGRLTGGDPLELEPRITLINGNVGRAISDEDLQAVEAVIREIIGDKLESVERAEGWAPALDLRMMGLLDADGEPMDLEEIEEEQHDLIRAFIIGDRLELTFSLLTEEEVSEVYGAVSTYFDFPREPPYNHAWRERHNQDIRDIYRPVTG